MSNELVTPKVLVCNSDGAKSKESDFLNNATTSFGRQAQDNRGLSYYAGIDAAEEKPQTILSGDRNLIDDAGMSLFPGTPSWNSQDYLTINNVNWGRDLHVLNGNIGLGDGSAQQVNSVTLKKQIANANISVNQTRFRYP